MTKRSRAFEVFNSQCACGSTVKDIGFPERWSIVPATKRGRRFLMGKSWTKVYDLPDQALLDNFELLCPYHFDVWTDDQEEDNTLWRNRRWGTKPRSAQAPS
jgi:hypothetical protein